MGSSDLGASNNSGANQNEPGAHHGFAQPEPGFDPSDNSAIKEHYANRDNNGVLAEEDGIEDDVEAEGRQKIADWEAVTGRKATEKERERMMEVTRRLHGGGWLEGAKAELVGQTTCPIEYFNRLVAENERTVSWVAQKMTVNSQKQAESQAKIKQLQGQIDKLITAKPVNDEECQAKLKEVKGHNDKLQTDNGQLQAANAKLQIENDKLQNAKTIDDEDSQAKLKEVQGHNDKLQAANDQLQADNDQVQTDNNKLRAANDQLQTDNDKLRAANNQLQVNNGKLQADNGQLQAANDNLQLDNDKLQADNNKLQAANVKLQAANDQLQTDNDKLQAAIDKLQADNNDLQGKLDHYKSNEKNLQERIERQDSELRATHTRLHEASEKTKFYQERNMESWNREQVLKDQVREHEETIQDLTRQLDEANAKGKGSPSQPDEPQSPAKGKAGKDATDGPANPETGSDGLDDSFDTVKILKEINEAKAANREYSVAANYLISRWMKQVSDDRNLREFHNAVDEFRGEHLALQNRILEFYQNLGFIVDDYTTADEALTEMDEHLQKVPNDKLKAKMWTLKIFADNILESGRTKAALLRESTAKMQLEMEKSDKTVQKEIDMKYEIYEEEEIDRRVDAKTQMYRHHRRDMLDVIFNASTDLFEITKKCPHAPTRTAITGVRDKYLDPLSLPMPKSIAPR